jgi:L-ascorbate metabolism protein UlaG (beta-lactamase superfamily)
MNTKFRKLLGAAAVFTLLAGCSTQPPAPSAGPQVQLWSLGHSAIHITTPGGKVIMLDPWLTTNPKTPAEYKDLDKIGKIDLILVSHAHFDHSADAPAMAKKWNATTIVPQGFELTLHSLGIIPVALMPRMGKGGTITPLPGIKVTAVHADHASEFNWTNPATGKQEIHVGGEPVGYIIELENGFKIYHMGDTALFGDLKLIGERYQPDLILVPIAGRYVMDPVDAAEATRMIRPKIAIPVHYGTRPDLPGTAEEYVAALGSSPTKVMILKPGDKLKF